MTDTIVTDNSAVIVTMQREIDELEAQLVKMRETLLHQTDLQLQAQHERDEFRAESESETLWAKHYFQLSESLRAQLEAAVEKIGEANHKIGQLQIEALRSAAELEAARDSRKRLVWLAASHKEAKTNLSNLLDEWIKERDAANQRAEQAESDARG